MAASADDIDRRDWTIYVLRCMKDPEDRFGTYYYVGKTQETVDDRFLEHSDKLGADWTMKHKPLIVEQHVLGCYSSEEESTMLRWVAKYGPKRVRGGSYAALNPTAEQTEAVMKVVYAITDCCYGCKQKGHFVKQCPVRLNAAARGGGAGKARSAAEERPVWSPMNHVTCSRCHRRGHDVLRCYARTDAVGKQL